MALIEQTLIEHFDKRIDDLKSDLKGDIGEVKGMLETHLEHCDKQMKEHHDEIDDLKAHKNKVIGALAVLGFLITVLSAILGSKGLL